MADTYTLISSVTVGAGGASSIDFTSIPSTYTDLLFVLSTRGSATGGNQDTVWIDSINGVTNSFTDRILRADGSSVSSFVPGETPLYVGQANTNAAGSTLNTFASHSIYIPNYLSSNYKSVSIDSVQENNSTTAYSGFTAAIWSNTNAITSVVFKPNGGYNFVQYSTAYLYGIKNS